jgi:mannosyl-oligosaccharide glucosidase
VLFSSASAQSPITSEDLTKGIEKIGGDFDKRFEEVFKPQPPFTGAKYLEFSKSLFSNLLGGIGYFYGDWRIDNSADPAYDEENEGFASEAAEARVKNLATTAGPNELFSSIPSRPFFPRGFLWDEGFHLLPIAEWDVDLTFQIVKSWFSLMDEDGWIAREQILGPEARSKVPEEFQTQYPTYANPPTLFLTLSQLVDRLTSAGAKDDEGGGDVRDVSPEMAKRYLKELYPLLQRHYDWFRRTQKGDLTSYDRPEGTVPKEAYRWRGRTERHCLTSGQDDFPRAQPPHPGELHVDALAWVSVMSQSLIKISSYLNEPEYADIYERHLAAQQKNAMTLHWSKEQGTFCDATVDDFEEHVLVCHKGYVTLLPFIVGLLDETKDTDKISAILKSLGDEKELWSEHGVRSLSKGSELYGTGENYWRGPVWVNLNYLILQRLSALGSGQSTNANTKEAGRLYKALRRNLVSTVFESWVGTGFAWEQYSAETGGGQRTRGFTGWTSLVVGILTMPEEAVAGARGRDEL